jgi:PAS domain S-box-containing protein
MTTIPQQDQPRRRRTVSQLLLTRLLLVLVPILALQAWVYHHDYQTRRDAELQANLEVARAVGAAFDAFVDDVWHQEKAIARAMTHLTPFSKQQATWYLVEARKVYPEVISISWLEPDGRVFASSDGHLVGKQWPDRSCVGKIVGGREWLATNVTRTQDAKDARFSVAHGARDPQGVLQGIVVAVVDPNRLDQVVDVHRSRGGAVALVDGSGWMAFRLPAAAMSYGDRDWRKLYEAVRGALRGREMTRVEYVTYQKGWRAVAAVPVASAGWAAGAGRSENEVLAPIKAGIARSALAFAAVMALGILLATVGARTITRPIGRLRASARAFGSGAFDTRVAEAGPTEFADLAAAFNRMADEIDRRERALQESEARYRGLFDTMQEGFALHEVICDDDGKPVDYRFLEVNPAFENLTGLRRDQIVGNTVREALPGLEPEWIETYGRVALTGEPARLERRATPLGRYYEAYAFSPSPYRFATIFSDITERWEAQAALRKAHDELERRIQERTKELRDANAALRTEIAERKHAEEQVRAASLYARSLIEASLDPLITISPEGKITDVNEATVKVTGISRDDIIGTDFCGYFTEPDKARDGYQRVFYLGSVTDYPLTIRHRDRTLTDVLYNASVYHDAGDNVLGVFAAARDVTAQKRAEEAVTVERRRFNDVLDMLPVYVVLLTPDYQVPFANRFFSGRFGESLGQRCFEYLFGRTEPCENCETYKTLKTNAPHRWEWTGPDGRNYDIFDFPFTDADGSPLILEVGLDITERKVAEQELRRHQERLEQLVEERTADLETRNAQLAAEIAERKQAEQALFDARQRLEWLLEAVPVGISFSDDATCQRITGNPACLAQFEIGPADNLSASAPDTGIAGRQVRYFQDGREISDVELPMQRAVAENREIGATELEVLLPSGRRWIAEASGAPIRDVAGNVIAGVAVTEDITKRKRLEQVEQARLEQARLLDTIVENTEVHLAYLDREFNLLRVNSTYASTWGYKPEQMMGMNHFDFYPYREDESIFRYVRDTGEVFHVHERPFDLPDQPGRGVTYWDWTVAPVKDDHGAVEGLVLSLTDATAQVRAREQLLAAERARTRTAETMVDEISHRMKNNLAIAAGLLQMQVAGEPEGSRPAAIIKDAVARLRSFAVVHELMYSMQQEEIELHTALRGVAGISSELYRDRQAEVSVSGDIVTYSSRTASNICIVANELITNAVKYGRPRRGGKLAVRIRIAREDDRLRLSVWNSGNPVPADFDPARQTGMGLQVVRTVAIEQYRGTFTMRPHRGGTVAEIVVDDQALRE